MAMVDTAWLVRTQNETISKKQTLWDTLFARQEKERDELMRFEERASSKPKVEIDDNIPETPTFPATSDPPLWVDATFDPPPLQLATDHTAPGGPAPLPLNRSRLRIKRKRARKERQDSGVASRAESREEGQPMNTEDETQPRAADQGQELCFKNWGLALSQELDPLASNFRELAVSDSGSDVGTVRSWDLVSEGESFGSPRRSGSSLDAGSVSGSEDSWDHLRNEVDSMDLWDNMVIPPPSDVVAHPAEELQPPVQGDIHCRDCDCRLGSKHDVYHGGSGDCSNDIFLNPVGCEL